MKIIDTVESVNLREYLINLTAKQKQLLNIATVELVSPTLESTQKKLGLDQCSIAGILGGFIKKPFNSNSLLELRSRDFEGNRVYGINESVVSRTELRGLLQELSNY
ncbi:MAG: hypothetical protein ACTSPI_17400 [Candidatus Heimdallarchaeaceae archaeon]